MKVSLTFYTSLFTLSTECIGGSVSLIPGADFPVPLLFSGVPVMHRIDGSTAQIEQYERMKKESANPLAKGPNSGEALCLKWTDLIATEATKDNELALKFLQQFEAEASCGSQVAANVACAFVAQVRDAIGGSFEPAKTRPTSVSETLSYSGLPNEKRVTATIILNPESAPKAGSLGNLFEEFLQSRTSTGKNLRVHNSIKVNPNDMLSISADEGMDGIYAFSHSNDKTHSIWIILYLGEKRKVEDGRRVISDFSSFLQSKQFTISESAVLTSEDEEKLERDSEADEEKGRLINLESLARFALRIKCSS